MTLYDYQDGFVDACGSAFAQGRRSVCGVLPTGAGKTRCAVAMCLRHLALDPDGSAKRSIVWLAPMRELVRQARAAFPSDVSVVTATTATEMQETLWARVHVSTVHALAQTGYRPRGTFVVLDEAQYFFGTPAWNGVAHDYLRQGARILSLTATPTRTDGSALRQLADEIVVGPSIGDMVARWRATGGVQGLTPPQVFAPKTRVDRGEDPVVAYLRHAAGTKAVVFCVDRAAARACADRFNAAGVPAAWADATNREGIAAHRAGDVLVLCNVFLISVGYDDPSIQTVVWDRGCGNRATFIQGNGRGMRVHAGKDRAIILDLLGNVHQHGLPQENVVYSLEGTAIRLANKKRDPLTACHDCGTLYRPGETACACGPVIRDRLVKPMTEKQRAKAALQEIHATEPAAIKRLFYDRLKEQAARENWSRWRAYARFKAHYGHPPDKSWG